MTAGFPLCERRGNILKALLTNKIFFMSDNLKKKTLDAKRISQQPWEQTYQRRKKETKEKELAAQQQVLLKRVPPKRFINDPVKIQLIPASIFRSELALPNRRTQKSALLKMENALLQNPIRSRHPIEFCKEWEEKGKPIFNMVLALFSFSPKTKAVIRRIMNGIDGVCKLPDPVVEP
jgi:hypothetical protein